MSTTAQRPLPRIGDENEFFWTSGADGRLRFQSCGACGELRHPPLPVCPSCGDTRVEIVAVSGRGVVAGCTVNEQPWLPGMPPPYAIAIVALEEDPRVRLTTNIVGCEPAEVRVGMRVQVRFEAHEDVWLPLFEPSDDPSPGEPPADEPVAERVRPMVRAEKFEDKVAITGAGLSRIGRRLMRSPIELAAEACRAAVADAGLELSDIDGLSTYPGPGLAGGHSEGGVNALEEALRLRPTWVNGAPQTPGQSGAVVAAMLAVAAGLCRHVLCFRTVWESTHVARQRAAGGSAFASAQGGAGRIDGDMQWRVPFGAASAANWIAMNASNHFHRYGTTRETLGWIALNGRKNAALNPAAIYREPLSMDDYLSARIISWPFGLFDCDIPCDGSTALVVSAADAAADARHGAVRVEAVGTQILERVSWDQGTLSLEPQVRGPAAHLWTRTDLKPSDVDAAQLYDGFTFNCLSWLESLGFCGPGEAKDFLEDGARIALDGELPLNTNGGQLSMGRLHGFGFLHEAVVQLRGQAGERQVQGAQVVAVSTGGGEPGGCMLLTAPR